MGMENTAFKKDKAPHNTLVQFHPRAGTPEKMSILFNGNKFNPSSRILFQYTDYQVSVHVCPFLVRTPTQ